MKTKVLYVLIVIGLFLTSCENSNQIQEMESPSQMSMSDLIGKTIEYRYGEDVYHVTIDSDSEMHWEAKAGGEIGTLEEETYKSEFIDNQKLFITWGEANGIGVSQILDFENGVVHNHLLRDRDISMGRGDIRILKD